MLQSYKDNFNCMLPKKLSEFAVFDMMSFDSKFFKATGRSSLDKKRRFRKKLDVAWKRGLRALILKMAK